MREEREVVAASGFVKYIGKLLRVVWTSRVNDLDREACRAGILAVQGWRKLLLRTKKVMRCGDEGLLGMGCRWGERLRQLLILVRSVPKLPNRRLGEAVMADVAEVQESVF